MLRYQLVGNLRWTDASLRQKKEELESERNFVVDVVDVIERMQ